MSDAFQMLQDVVVRAMGTCTTCQRTDCDTCINMNSHWIPDARAALAAAKREELQRAEMNGELARMPDCEKAQGDNAAKSPEALSCESVLPAPIPYANIDGQRVAVLHGRIAKTPDGRTHEVVAPAAHNAAAMLEALRKINGICGIGVVEVSSFEIGSICDAALSTPPRNCDRFATEEEAKKEWWEKERENPEYVKWLFATATQKGGKQ